MAEYYIPATESETRALYFCDAVRTLATDRIEQDEIYDGSKEMLTASYDLNSVYEVYKDIHYELRVAHTEDKSVAELRAELSFNDDEHVRAICRRRYVVDRSCDDLITEVNEAEQKDESLAQDSRLVTAFDSYKDHRISKELEAMMRSNYQPREEISAATSIEIERQVPNSPNFASWLEQASASQEDLLTRKTYILKARQVLNNALSISTFEDRFSSDEFQQLDILMSLATEKRIEPMSDAEAIELLRS